MTNITTNPIAKPTINIELSTISVNFNFSIVHRAILFFSFHGQRQGCILVPIRCGSEATIPLKLSMRAMANYTS